MMTRTDQLFLFVLMALFLPSNCFSIDRGRIPGIWSLVSESLPYEQDIRAKLQGLMPDEPPAEDVLLKLNEDGTFKQCNEGYQEGKWISGRWKIACDHGHSLLLAMNRQYYGPPYDVLLVGTFIQQGNSTSSLQIEGQIEKGKFMYPQTHPSFFESPLVDKRPVGAFHLHQSLATQTVLSGVEKHRHKTEESSSENSNTTTFEVNDFYHRTFIMTVEPIKLPKMGESIDDDMSNLPVDFRAFPISFYQNNTFQALAMNKNLRGRFHIAGNDELAFDVSVFGAGRSMPGSVFSDGIGLSHEDKRSYLGRISEKRGRLFVEGTVSFGTDFGSDARPEPVGIFLLTEVIEEDSSLATDDDDISNGEVFG